MRIFSSGIIFECVLPMFLLKVAVFRYFMYPKSHSLPSSSYHYHQHHHHYRPQCHHCCFKYCDYDNRIVAFIYVFLCKWCLDHYLKTVINYSFPLLSILLFFNLNRTMSYENTQIVLSVINCRYFYFHK